MNTVGFIGLGLMGSPMARNIARAGYRLGVYNRSREKAAAFADEGVRVYDHPADLARESDVVVIMVTGPDALLDVLDGPEGVVAGLRPGATVVNMSTVSVAATHEAHRRVTEAGGRFLDAPVSGTVQPAIDGTLTILVGGEPDLIETWRPLLGAMGRTVLPCGPVGQGTAMKLAVNLLLGGMMQSFVEALALGRRLGLELDGLLAAIASGALNAPMFAAKGAMIRAGDFVPRFSIDLLHKDLALALQEAATAGVYLPATAAVREALNGARALGHGGSDIAAAVRLLEHVSGVNVGPG